MAKLEFIHLSDLHLMRDYRNSSLWGYVDAMGRTPTEVLSATLDHIRDHCGHIDFVLVTGDLAHDGVIETYGLLRDMLRERIGDLPVFVTLGNHDKRAAFRLGFLAETADDAPYCHCRDVNGYRIIALDGSRTEGPMGLLEDQLDWLRAQVREPATRGSLLALHYPPSLLVETGHLLQTADVASEIESIVRSSDIRAVFAGHLHSPGASTFGGVPLFIAGSLAFGLSITANGILSTDRLGYNYCIADEGRIAVEHRAPPVDYKVLLKRPTPF